MRLSVSGGDVAAFIVGLVTPALWMIELIVGAIGGPRVGLGTFICPAMHLGTRLFERVHSDGIGSLLLLALLVLMNALTYGVAWHLFRLGRRGNRRAFVGVVAGVVAWIVYFIWLGGLA